MSSPVPIVLTWIAFVPSTAALWMASVFNELLISGARNYHSFTSYFAMLVCFCTFALFNTIMLKMALEIPCGPCELGNMLVECMDLLPATQSFSVLNTWWLRAAGVGVQSNNIFSCAPTPRNASTVVIGDNVFLSNTIITGPATLRDDCLLDLKARVREHCVLNQMAVVGGHTILRRGTTVDAGAVIVRQWDVRSDAQAPPSPTPWQAVRRQNLSSSVPGDLLEAEMRKLGGGTGTARSGERHVYFPTWQSHVAYVLPRLLQLHLLLAVMAGCMCLANRACGASFFSSTISASSSTGNRSDERLRALGFLGFFVGFTFLCLPLTMVLAKWSVLGRWQRCDVSEHFPTTSAPCWRYFCFVAAPIWIVVRSSWQPRLYGTLLQNQRYRCMGSEIGRRVLIFSNGVEDYDHLRIEGDAAIGHGCFVLGHLFEGRGLSFGKVHLGEGCSVLSDRQIWPGAVIPAFATVARRGPPIRGACGGEPAKSSAPALPGLSLGQQGDKETPDSERGFPEIRRRVFSYPTARCQDQTISTFTFGALPDSEAASFRI
ncbi:unnamed protein product [Prorocentrum cordatum]|uniref:Uncharacterized protein n=1 Tax=Prorocentrum cordatum TaxID=2364126 RepID=A0ABN9VHV7_9DINO|nr:unnamed protein product [Polarella glacialis]